VVLLKQLLGDPVLTEHLGGPESDDQLAGRHTRYLRSDSTNDRMFKIVHEPTGTAIGSVGYWERTWQGEVIYETGWMVLPSFQGRGIASAATAQTISRARADGQHRFLHAFPAADNPASNAICRKVGFTLLGACEFEYPKGHVMQCTDWCLDLFEKHLVCGSTEILF
jgi:RimJ/RimL family protein N-acetyltransferase